MRQLVFLIFGQGTQQGTVPLWLELGTDEVHLRAMLDRDRTLACRALADLHLRYFLGGVPHRVAVDRDGLRLQCIDALSVPREAAEQYLFPHIRGLADSAEVRQGVH